MSEFEQQSTSNGYCNGFHIETQQNGVEEVDQEIPQLVYIVGLPHISEHKFRRQQEIIVYCDNPNWIISGRLHKLNEWNTRQEIDAHKVSFYEILKLFIVEWK